MLEISREFHWAAVDRDRTPEVPQRLNVSAYPSLLVLGKEEENVHRFEGFCKKQELVGRLHEALRRFALYRAGKEWDAPTPRPEKIADGPGISSIPAPSDGIPSGMASLGGDLFVGQGTALARLDAATGKAKATLPLPEGVADLASDGKSLWAVPYGWTCGQPILVLDPETGKTLRSVVTEENLKFKHYGAKGIAWHAGRLFVLEGMEGRIRELDPETGAIKATIQTPLRWLGGLSSDGKNLVSATREKVVRLDPATGAVTAETPVHYWIRALETHDGALFAMEQPVFGHGRKHETITLWPRKGETRVWRLGP